MEQRLKVPPAGGHAMTSETPTRALLFEGSGRARVRVGDRVFEDVPIVALVEENAQEPADMTVPSLVLRPAFTEAVAVIPGERVQGVELYHARFHEDGSLEEVRVRVRDVRERKPKGDPFWSRVFGRKKE